MDQTANPLAAAFAAWNSRELYLQTHRNKRKTYRLKSTGRVAPYSKAILAQFPDNRDFHIAAHSVRAQDQAQAR